jgi:NAD(P)-dependent dehydrogenase (short-subunit alcohol dehydrogenase family)
VCNNAAIVDRFLPAGEMTVEVWNRVLDVKLTAPMRLARAAIPVMLRAGRGVIINTASVAGLAGGRAGAAYTASKHGLIGLAQNIAASYGRDGIRCVAIAHGAVNTASARAASPVNVATQPSARPCPRTYGPQSRLRSPTSPCFCPAMRQAS